MRDSVSGPARSVTATGVPQGAPVLDWRTDVRPALLSHLATLATRMEWSEPLLRALLDELYVNDEFDHLVEPVVLTAGRVHRDAARQLGLALLLRRSWDPDNLADLVRRLGLVPPSLVHSTTPRTTTPADRGHRRRRQGRTSPRGPRARKETS